ncbi:5-(carboxyamino)imidazole ribonucleotide synthase [Natronoglycomyces albus]|uniref:N5-carboxyaminoimidazole ribonucleotide synthase n=1 Tax=Natronoglycomyces albus TaxID=2811108 RepID=A0A895XNP5_9ACTN|nr:5-(carboxyamino)imidazole ribonucleotide synthase [Natronoglycomyces albus]QSB04685.1 5-(carboxyamino)imidazole ribonucleotide synthase [Natronoglycomyces albus]
MDGATQLPIVGMIGAGQLARMTHQSAIALGQSLRVLAAADDESAAVVATDVTYGDYTQLAALRRFASGCTVVTFDHEHVPGSALRQLVADGVEVQPGPEALQYAQDKQLMREKLHTMGAPMPRWAPITSLDDLEAFGFPCVLKAARGGYDGKGVWMIDSLAAAEAVLDSGIRLIAEEKAQLQRELAIQIARSPSGEMKAYPVVETVQRDGVCVEVLAPAPDLDPEVAKEITELGMSIAQELGVCGMLAVELFETPTGITVNELAMRPHNSGHWSMDGAVTSQFEQHLRAVLDYPLGDTAPVAPFTVMANVLGGYHRPEGEQARRGGGPRLDERLQHLMNDDPGVKVHLYGKAVRPGRKIGHVNVCGDDLDQLRRRAARAAAWLRDGRV